MSQAYSDPERESDPYALPDVETFQGMEYPELVLDDDSILQWDKWYWWSCFPGCLPDSDPIGPFETEEDALADAQDNE